MAANIDTSPHVLRARAIHTFAGRKRTARAVAWNEGRIVAVGTRAVSAWEQTLPKRKIGVLDLPHAVITPGLVDAHTHFGYWAVFRNRVIDLSLAGSVDEALARVQREARKKHLGGWVLGSGFDHNRWTAAALHAKVLDRAVADRPVMLKSRDYHSAWLNSQALRAVGITAKTPDPAGGVIRRDDRGRPTGLLHETAVNLLPDPVRQFLARTDRAACREIDAILSAAYRYAHSLGITGVHVMDDAPSLYHFQRQAQEKTLRLRVVHAIPLKVLDQAIALGLRSGLGDAFVRIGGVKMFVDGALGSQTAYMFDDYPGRSGYCGVPVLAGAELKEAVTRAARHGLASWIHAIGDRAVHEAVTAIAAAARAEAPPLPHRVEHVQCARAADIRKMAKHGIIASVQPCHLPGDITTAQRYWPRAQRNAYAFARMREAGVVMAAGSDVPVETLDPRVGLFGAVTRQSLDGVPADGWIPAQRIDARATLEAYTRGAAAAGGQVHGPGCIAEGVPADLTVWLEDPLNSQPNQLRNIPIAGSVVAGVPYLEHNAAR